VKRPPQPAWLFYAKAILFLPFLILSNVLIIIISAIDRAATFVGEKWMSP
jgi:hypothetical protein